MNELSATPQPLEWTLLLDYFRSACPAVPPPIAHSRQDKPSVELHPRALREAAVLVPITRPRADCESHVVLTVRSARMKSHAGQVSFPGGSREPKDCDSVATALREAQEEIGLPPSQVSVLGKLGDLALASGYRITPVVGLVESDCAFTACPVEVAEIFRVPLDLVMNPDAYRSTTMQLNGQGRSILELSYEGYRIWGATAAILFHLAGEIRRSP